MFKYCAAAVIALTCSVAFAEDEFTVYELLAPDTHRFAIVYDVATSHEGDKFFLNPIRRGSKATDERVIDLATGKNLKFEVVDGKTAKADGIRPAATPDDSLFLKVNLAAPVPKNGQARIRIYKVYEDAASYTAQGDRIVFDRPLGIRRNVIVLPAGYELIASSVPSIVSTGPDGRIRVSMLNDRDDMLREDHRQEAALKLGVLALLPALLLAQFHRAEQDREIRYWLLDPDSHQFRISHDFTVTRVGQKYVHSFVRKGSVVSKSVVIDLSTGKELETSNVTGKSVNALGYYPAPTDPESVVVQGNLDHALLEGETVRVRVIETYSDPEGYRVRDGELTWDRTLGRPFNQVALPPGWMLTSVSVPAIVSLDADSNVLCRFTNPRNDELHVILKAKRRP